MTAVIEVCKKNRHILPLEKFVNGRVDQSQADDLTCRLLGSTDTTKLQDKNKKIMVAESPHMTYVGKNFGQSKLQQSKNLMKHYVGVYDKKTGKMKVYDTETFNMLPHIPGEEKDEPDEPAAEKTFQEKFDMLTTAFGSNKKKRTLDTKMRHAVDNTTLKGVMKSTVDRGLQDMQTYKTQKDDTTDAAQMSTIPPCNKEATIVEDVYKLSDILSDRDLNDLHKSAQVFFDSTIIQIMEWTKEQKYPTHILTKLQTMPISDEARWLRTKCLLYMSYLIHFYRLPQSKLGRNDALPDTCPPSIRKKMLNNFTIVIEDGSKSKRSRPNRLKDRLVSYILTLALILDEFNLVPLDLQKDLKLGKTKMGHYLRALGCRLINIKQDDSFYYEAALKLPLIFPKTSMRKY